MEVVNKKQFNVQKEVEYSHGRNVGKLVWNLTLWVGKVFHSLFTRVHVLKVGD
jgi:hypothetical protein